MTTLAPTIADEIEARMRRGVWEQSRQSQEADGAELDHLINTGRRRLPGS